MRLIVHAFLRPFTQLNFTFSKISNSIAIKFHWSNGKFVMTRNWNNQNPNSAINGINGVEEMFNAVLGQFGSNGNRKSSLS